MRFAAILSLFLFSAMVQANSEVNKLLDSYLVASADSHLMQMKDEEIKKTPFTIQIASYMNEKDAVAHVNELKYKEKSIYYYPSFVRGQVWFKVCVGQFTEKSMAEEYRKTFVKKFDEPFAVVVSLLDVSNSKFDKNRMPASADAKKPVVKSEVAEETVKEAPKVVSKDVAPGLAKPMVEPALAKVETKVQEPKVASAIPAGAFSVQIAAYSDEKSVREGQEALVKKGHEAFYQSAMVQGKTWYRLFVGHFGSKTDAQKFLESLDSSVKKKDSFVRPMTAEK